LQDYSDEYGADLEDEGKGWRVRYEVEMLNETCFHARLQYHEDRKGDSLGVNVNRGGEGKLSACAKCKSMRTACPLMGKSFMVKASIPVGSPGGRRRRVPVVMGVVIALRDHAD
jgi:hypothetical protein